MLRLLLTLDTMPIPMFHKPLLAALLLALNVSTPTTAQTSTSNNYPTKAIRLVVPFTPGGSADILGRTIALELSQAWGQPVIVENVAGAGGTIASAKVAKSKPDGYTIYIHHMGMATAPALYKKLPFNPLKDFEYIGQVVDVPMTLIARKNFPANNYQELITYLKANKDVVLVWPYKDCVLEGGMTKEDQKRDEIFYNETLAPDDSRALVRSVMNERQRKEFGDTLECNFAISLDGIGRFRVSAFVQQGQAGMVVRTITTDIPELESLGVPPQLKDIVMGKRGLVIMVGATGSGKSTTLAAMIGHRNANSHGHIITIEDPIEFVHPHLNCIVTQREVGTDTEDWHTALKNTLRQAPDVILMGEIRDRETMEHAIAFAETGHLCMATLHANSANQALDRVINFFPEERRAQLLMDLSLNLRAMVCQRLVPRQDGKGRQAAVEIMLNSPLVSDLVFKGEVTGIKEIMKKSRNLGMQTFDQALFDAYENNLITYEDALRNADSVNDLRLQIKLNSQRAKTQDLAAGTEHLHIAHAVDPRQFILHVENAVIGQVQIVVTLIHWRTTRFFNGFSSDITGKIASCLHWIIVL